MECDRGRRTNKSVDQFVFMIGGGGGFIFSQGSPQSFQSGFTFGVGGGQRRKKIGSGLEGTAQQCLSATPF